MSKILKDISIEINEDLEEKLSWLSPQYSTYHILKKSVDARKSKKPHFVYTVEVFDQNETPHKNTFPIEKVDYKSEPVLIIGSGPAGLFAAIRLLERGIPCIIFEQGSKANDRIKGINRFWRYGELNKKNNVCFGEGGAGLYSDGKLITRIKSPHIPYVLQRLVKFGAPQEIEYLANPHVGSDKIRRVIPKIRDYILSLGGQILFDTKVTEVLTNNNAIRGVTTENGQTFLSPHLILACGHSAEDLFQHLNEIGVKIEGKSFAIGLRIEHPQHAINKIQYREYAEHPKLGAANYKLAYHDKKTQVGVYSFCMCPGGYVLSSGTSEDGVVCNGMSNYNRNSPYANAAIVVSIDHNSLFGKDIWGGMKFRQKLEQEAHQMVLKNKGTHQIPVQTLSDFINQKSTSTLPSSSPSGVTAARLDQLVGKTLYTQLIFALEQFNKNMKGFISDEAQLHGIESRTSCPIRITRDDNTLESLSHQGLYPCGEGAGYAGGITSAACDGINVAEAIVQKVASQIVLK